MRKRVLLCALIVFAAFSSGVLLSHFLPSIATEDARFEAYTTDLFKSQVVSNTVSLHYTLSEPEAYGINDYPVTLGQVSTQNLDPQYALLENERARLASFDYTALSDENRLTYDILDLSLKTDLESREFYLLEEYLSPSLGIQAQLPILFAEYPFRKKQDIENYLELIALTDEYFAQILEFEKEKSTAGFFMNEASVDGIINQCEAFIKNPEENYLLSIFEDKISECSFLSDRKKAQYIETHKTRITEHLIPAYENIIHSLTSLKGSEKNPYGLYYDSDGRKYYEYLVKSTTGVYDSIPVIEARLRRQLSQDFFRMHRLLKVNPSLSNVYEETAALPENLASPEEILQDLQGQMVYDFPALSEAEYQIKYVHPDLKDYLSPAFYLTPPFDALSPNSIYLNTEFALTGTSLYTTLAHEGFPGHLYQSQYFAQSDPSPIRYLLSVGGYIEGWATYTEQYAYQYAPADRILGEVMWLNRSMNLCLYSLADIGIHYYGWTPQNAKEFFNNFGITDEAAILDIYQRLLEDPANYLQYYVGCLSFMDLREKMEELQGNEFDLQSFHKRVLEIGPAPFPILEKYLGLS